MPIASRQAFDQTGLFKFLDESEFDVLLAYVAFERTGESEWCVADSIGWFWYDHATASVHAVPVYNQELSKHGHSAARYVVETYAAV